MSFHQPVPLSALVEQFNARPEDRDTISLETLGLGTDDIDSIAQESPAAFFRALNKLSPEDQHLLLGYHVLKTTQTNLGKVFGYNQSACAKQLWIASRRLAFHLFFPDPLRKPADRSFARSLWRLCAIRSKGGGLGK